MNKDIKNFFEYMGFYNENYFRIIEKKTIIIKRPYELIIELVGVFQNEDGTDFRIYLPELSCIKDYLIHVHEYSHVMFLEDNDEIFPNLMEVYFIKRYIKNIDIINSIINHTKVEIEESNDDNHTIAKRVKLKELVNYKNSIIN